MAGPARGCRNTLLWEEAGHKWPQDTYLDTVSTTGHSTEAESGSCQGRAGGRGLGAAHGDGVCVMSTPWNQTVVVVVQRGLGQMPGTVHVQRWLLGHSNDVGAASAEATRRVGGPCLTAPVLIPLCRARRGDSGRTTSLSVSRFPRLPESPRRAQVRGRRRAGRTSHQPLLPPRPRTRGGRDSRPWRLLNTLEPACPACTQSNPHAVPF